MEHDTEVKEGKNVEFENPIQMHLPRNSRAAYKGQAGKIGVIGGCFTYTGAPYFASMSSLRVGADLTHVFCTKDAAIPIKSFSPDIVAHPIMPSDPSYNEENEVYKTGKYSEDNFNEIPPRLVDAVNYITSWFNRLTCLVIGPGLGQEFMAQEIVKYVIHAAVVYEMPLVIDGDGLRVVNAHPILIKGYKWAVITPNVVEFRRLCASVLHEVIDLPGESQWEDISQETEKENLLKWRKEFREITWRLGSVLENVTVVCKGMEDIISSGLLGSSNKIDRSAGCRRRVGGQGDILAGITGAFLSWHRSYWESIESEAMSNEQCAEIVASAAAGACLITRCCSDLAYKRLGTSMLTSDMIDELKMMDIRDELYELCV